MVMEAVASAAEDQDSDDPGATADNQLSLDDLLKPADWLEHQNWGTFTRDASCTPADITYPTDLKQLNEARESTERCGHSLEERHYQLVQYSHRATDAAYHRQMEP